MAKSILIVEDDEPVLGLMAAALVKEGYEVSKAKDVHEAINLWDAKSFDLLLTDVRLSIEDDGFGLAKTLLEKRPGVPVIFISGDKDCFSCPNVPLFGDSPFIAKPFNVKKMLEAVRNVIAGTNVGVV